jgi:predicted O-methyltransferase YrrM
MADNLLTHPFSTITTIDAWVIDPHYGLQGNKAFKANLAQCLRREQIQSLGMDSAKALRQLAPFFDFAYIDGSHEAKDIISDWVGVLAVMRPNGLVCFDDYLWEDTNAKIYPKDAIDLILDWWSDQIVVLERGNQIWLRVK